MNIPEDLRYTREHEWLHLDDDIAAFGITDYAQGELGDIVFVELPAVGDVMSANDPSGTIEAVKTVADLFAPVGGEVVEVNERLADDPDARVIYKFGAAHTGRGYSPYHQLDLGNQAAELAFAAGGESFHLFVFGRYFRAMALDRMSSRSTRVPSTASSVPTAPRLP